MSVAHRKLSRLPLTLYGSLKEPYEGDRDDGADATAAALRDAICFKLRAQRKTGGNESSIEGVTTVGDLLLLSPLALLRILDPLLTYGTMLSLFYFVCQ